MTTRDGARNARGTKLDELHKRLTGAVEALVSGENWRRAPEYAARFQSRSAGRTGVFEVRERSASGSVSAVGGVVRPLSFRVGCVAVDAGDSESEDAGEHGWRDLSGELFGGGQPRLLEDQAPTGLWDGLSAQVESAGFEVMRVPHEGMIHGANGLADYTTKTVAVREEMSHAAQVKTLTHVLMHGPDNDEAVAHRGIGEVEVESVMIGAAHGMDTSDYTIPYVASWAARVDGKDPMQLVQATGERVRKIALQVLDRLDTAQVADSVPPGLDRAAPERGRPAPEQSGARRSEEPPPRREPPAVSAMSVGAGLGL
ncbi:serine/arginine repetitive matrix protein 2 [Microlunatus parietis]|uniref:Uncharacterized protein n=1 Tax=Microlunatus parietis TaxID=682979 RepID=A0A7Y9I8S8_9ACTN|nr:serine/arginine repetitive matrix protein 2 [Microlunatus parietis]NYE72113.1 hypothetical protein [Microlunatus parietis]